MVAGARTHQHLRDLARPAVVISADETAEQVARRFRGSESLRTIVVRRGSRVAAVSRIGFFAMMTGPYGYGWALHARRPIGELLEERPVVVDVERRVVDVAWEAINDVGTRDFDDVVVLDAAAGQVLTVRIDELMHSMSAQFRHLSHTDDLTGLLNRRGLLTLLEGVGNERTPGDHAATVLFIDLDHFKLVNDAFGHDVGDVVLRATAERLRRSAPPGAVCARVGGDEFVVAGPPLERAASESVADVLRIALRDPIEVGADRISLAATVGLAEVGRHVTVADMLKRADLAMYEGKRRGGDRVTVVDDDQLTHFAQLARAEAALPDAIESGEIRAAYQPLVSLIDGRIVGAEALARWRRGDDEISPGVFIPIAERRGLIPALTDHLLGVIAAEVRRVEAGHESSSRSRGGVAVNVSASHCATDGFADWLLARLNDVGLDPHRVVVEITESVVFDHMERIVASTNRLTDAGIRVSLDDFGAGYSSLAVLSRLPLDTVKLDRSLVVGMPESDRTLATAAAVVDLAHRLGSSVVAEGVETIEQFRAAHDIGCDVGQGFLFGRPGPHLRDGAMELPARDGSFATSRAG